MISIWSNLDRYYSERDIYFRLKKGILAEELNLKGVDYSNSNLVLSRVEEKMESIVRNFGKAAGIK